MVLRGRVPRPHKISVKCSTRLLVILLIEGSVEWSEVSHVSDEKYAVINLQNNGTIRVIKYTECSKKRNPGFNFVITSVNVHRF